ncbi:MAG: flagellar basal body-associated FliL family protein [Bdellovibrionales bacterium]|nr:flagellar basal body-associated FliL family protein [Bdellovibrionales bacterium]
MTGNKGIDTIIAALATVASLLTVGVFVYTEMIYEKPLPDNEQAVEELMTQSKQQLFSDYFKLEPLIINLPSSKTSRLRFLSIKTHIKPFKSEYLDILEKEKAYIHDIVIDIVSGMKPDELNSLYGKILLDGRIKKTINKRFNKPIVEAIFFSKFTIQ